MITEDYVSFEVAKLLKEKGFDGKCHSHYYSCHYPDGSIQYHKYESSVKGDKCWYDVYSLKTLPVDHYLAPTLQIAMKWLREVHHLHIIPEISDVSRLNPQYYVVIWLTTSKRESYILELFDSYEEACEAAIKYCLENLI